MKNRPSQATRLGRRQPLDHLRPGGLPTTGPETGAPDEPPRETARRSTGRDESAQPAEPATPGAGDADAIRGKATGSPAAVGTRPHLEGSEQGPS
jgi:hypothetical protein